MAADSRERWSDLPKSKADQHDSFKSKANVGDNYAYLKSISTSVYVTNFPIDISQSELRKHCEKWGTIVDVYISTRLSRFGKRFGFLRFTGVDNLQLLIDNLRTVWIGKFLMYADYARDYQQSKSNSDSKMDEIRSYKRDVKEPNQPVSDKRTFADLFKSYDSHKEPCKKKQVVIPIEVCLNATNSNFVIAKALDVSYIPNLRDLCVKEGFEDVLIRYIGGRWVSILFPNVEVASKFDKCEHLKKCFSCIQVLSQSFIPDERCVWLDIIGLPVVASTPSALKHIGDLWGEFLFTGGDKEEPLAEGKICVLTSCKNPIFESIIVDVDGDKVEVWVKEYASWAPTLYTKEMNSDTVSPRDELFSMEGDAHSQVEQKEETKVKVGVDDSQFVGSDILTNEIEVNTPTRSKEIPITDRADDDLPDLNRKLDDKIQPQSYVEDNGNMKGQDQDGLTYIGGKVESETLPNLDEGVRRPDHIVENAIKDHKIGISKTREVNSDMIWDKIWFYRDPSRKIQGPFSIIQLRNWITCFPKDHKIWNTFGSEKDGVLLHTAVKKEHRESSNGG